MRKIRTGKEAAEISQRRRQDLIAVYMSNFR